MELPLVATPVSGQPTLAVVPPLRIHDADEAGGLVTGFRLAAGSSLDDQTVEEESKGSRIDDAERVALVDLRADLCRPEAWRCAPWSSQGRRGSGALLSLRRLHALGFAELDPYAHRERTHQEAAPRAGSSEGLGLPIPWSCSARAS